ncbi:bifunctional adenosylcobinamide kinase/adenosylcobinamide-phosphate guanylyltransferase [Rhabdaerophilum calidifontis]|uniref:bifunctional adenosylcobinamide kinase/adenosylcobinamide-phosphate guanylyltransferase n=1 Tax=Rhabdaerophilum calidifontis TaxID=2604328 RepID=UPI00123BA6D6|nr:bifunctional adenosylcobinamide kinase/adenosylcobinamide-phosphate guanylyltransferase [Rhabdaerophilum calidifontis]
MSGLPPPPSGTTLVLGGARSGKSRHAEALARETGRERLYIATAEPFDDEMRARIARHRADRTRDGWTTLEIPRALPEALVRESRPERVLLVDCLTLWLSNVLLAGADPEQEGAMLVAALAAARGAVILVSNEVGLGLVPETPLGRRFRDAQGRLNQQVAAIAARVHFVAAGLPLVLKGGVSGAG